MGREPQGPGALPVMIWIHGGGYQEGDSCEYAIDSLAAASGGSVIVVSVNCEPSRLPPLPARAELNALGECRQAGAAGLPRRAGSPLAHQRRRRWQLWDPRSDAHLIL